MPQGSSKKIVRKSTYHTKSTAKKWPAGRERKWWLRFGKRHPGLFLFCALCFGLHKPWHTLVKPIVFKPLSLSKVGS